MAWNQTSSAPKKAPTRQGLSPVVKGLLALVVICALGGLVWWFVSSKPLVKEKKSRTKVEIAEVTPAKPREVVKVEPEVKPIDPLAGVDPQNQKFGQLPDGRWTVPGRKKIHNVVTNFSNTAGEVAYRNGTEQALLMVFSKRRGDMPSVLPNLSKKDRDNLVNILLDKAVVTAEDDEWMREDKEIINLAKEELRAYLKEGGDVDSFFEYYHKELMKSYNERKIAVQTVFEAAQTQDPDLAEEFCKKVNERLSEKGIRPVMIPNKIIEKKRREMGL